MRGRLPAAHAAKQPRARILKATPEQLAKLAPLAGLSPERLAELAEATAIERAARGADPLAGRAEGQSVFLLAGETLLSFQGGGTLVVVGGSDETRMALNRRKERIARARRSPTSTCWCIEDETLDILATWDQLAGVDPEEHRAVRRSIAARFRSAPCAPAPSRSCPAARIDELLRRFERVKTARGETVIREGDEGDYYYIIDSGRFQVGRLVGGAEVVLAELKSGDAFGEEALVSEAKRNATVTALTDGQVLRLNRAHFNELLREPLLRRIGFAQAAEQGAPRRALARCAISLGIPVRQAAGRDQRAFGGSTQHVRCARSHKGVHRLLPERPPQRRGGVSVRPAGLQSVAFGGRVKSCGEAGNSLKIRVPGLTMCRSSKK